MNATLRVGVGSLLALGFVFVALTPAADDTSPDPKDVKAVIDKAVAYMKKSQKGDGSWSMRAPAGGTALALAALLRTGLSADDSNVAKGITYMEGKVQKDGGIYDKFLANYTTSVAVMAFSEANAGGKYDKLIKDATAFIKKLQYDDEKDIRYGGVGYDAKSRPDMSNTQFFVDALIAAGVAKDDPAIQRALKFVSRCQNLPGETNDFPFAKKAKEEDKGGLVYNPFDMDKNTLKPADETLTARGSMTYAGLKSFLYAGVDKNDPRVKAAIDWIRKHYTLDENPGEGDSGLFYYYHTFAKAQTALGEDPFVDAKGNKHAWKKELFEVLKKKQRDDGSWVNAKDRAYGESDPDLATAFALLTLSYCKAKK